MTKLLIDLAPLVMSSACVLLAQVSDIDPDILVLVGNGVTVAVLAWYVIYDVRVRTPSMIQAFRQEQVDARDFFERDRTSIREYHDRQIESIKQAFLSEQIESRKYHDKILAEYRKILEDFASSYRILHEDLKSVLSKLKINID